MSLKFSHIVLLEQIRRLEQSGQIGADVSASADDLASAPAGRPFIDRALARAGFIVQQGNLADRLARPARLLAWILSATALLCGLLGMLAVSRALAGASGNAVNVYWLLVVLLGINWLSMALWLAGWVAGAGGLIGGVVGQVPAALLARTAGRGDAAARAWLDCHFTGQAGLWRISALSHLLWLCYLLAGLAALVALFAVQQFDFYWGSTLLSSEGFAALTHWLSGPLASLGLAAPGGELLAASRVGVDGGEAADQVRRQWALFLLAAVVLYGVVPRLLCWLLAQALLHRAERRLTPDLYLPYYMDMRQRLSPAATAPQVVDADDDLPAAHLPRGGEVTEAGQLPPGLVLVGLELPDGDASAVAANVTGRDSLRRARQVADAGSGAPLAIVVHWRSLPDRGMQRQIHGLLENHAPARRWLILTGDPVAGNLSAADRERRLADWYRAAQQAGVPAQQVVNVPRDRLAAGGEP